MANQDIRWIQRFNNFSKALQQLTQIVEKSELNEIEKQGLIKSFEYNYELAWNTIKDFYEHQAETNIQGSRDAFRLAFKRGLIEDGQTWMDMIKSRNQTAHTYNEETAQEIITEVENRYYQAFCDLAQKLENFKNKTLSES